MSFTQKIFRELRRSCRTSVEDISKVPALQGIIENYGTAKTALRASPDALAIACEWSAADVHRPLHAVVKVTGTVEQPKADVLFCAGKAVVVPTSTRDRVLQTVKPMLQYDRKVDLFTAELTVSAGFPGQGAAR